MWEGSTVGYSDLVAAKKMVRERVRRYGLRSQRGLAHFKSSRLLEENGLVLPESSRNCMFPSTGSETMKHWLVKAMIFKLLRGMGRSVGTEVEVNGGIVDLVDADNMIAYEVENNLTREKLKSKLTSLSGMRDVFFIDILDVPDDIFEAEDYIRKKVV